MYIHLQGSANICETGGRPKLKDNNPEEGHFYQIKAGDNLLHITTRAYGVKAGQERLKLARLINNDPFNLRLRRPEPVDLFPEGIISFYAEFTDPATQLKAKGKPPAGKEYAVIKIPCRTEPQPGPNDIMDNYHPFLGKLRPLPLSKVDSALDGELFEEAATQVAGLGSQTRVNDTTRHPFRWVCQLNIVFKEREGFGRFFGSGSGVLISPSHVLTAAHCLDYFKGSTRIIAEAIGVIPGFNRAAKLGHRRPFGSARKTAFKVPDRWSERLDAGIYNPDFDYGLIKLNKPISDKAGFWGRQGWVIKPANKKSIDGRTVHFSGYPSVKSVKKGTQWTARGSVDLGLLNNDAWYEDYPNPLSVEPFPKRTIYFPGDFSNTRGQSGGPIWSKHRVSNRDVRHLVAIVVVGGHLQIRGTHHVQGSLITPKVLENIEKWKRSM